MPIGGGLYYLLYYDVCWLLLDNLGLLLDCLDTCVDLWVGVICIGILGLLIDWLLLVQGA